ncbi:alpha/beta fold hydrolase [Ferdinandcohnia sp. Marseille-Q9671]
MGLHYQEYGDKSAPLMLFLHGGGVSGWMWDKQISYFTDYHCIVLDLPEHGKSKDSPPFSIKGSAEEVIKIIEDKAEGKKVILIGFSLGAQVIVQMLSMKPHLADVAFINSALVQPMSNAKKWIQPTIRFSFPLIKMRWFSKLQANTLYVGEDYFEQYYEESSQMKLETLVRVLEENMSFDIPAGFEKATGKILVTVGEKEKAVMKKSAKNLVETNSNCTAIIFPNMGHGVSMAMPDFFNTFIDTYINDGKLPSNCRRIGD